MLEIPPYHQPDASKLAGVDLNHLRALHVLLEEASVRRAAARLGVTPPAASNALRRLRDVFGDALLVQSGRAMVRTPMAEALRAPAAQFVSAAAAVMHPAAFDPATWDGAVPILMSDYTCSVVIARLDRELRDALPRAHLSVTSPGAGADPVEWLRAHGGFVIDPFRSASPEVVTDEFYEDRFVVAMRREHAAASQRLTLPRFCKLSHVLVSPRGGRSGMVDEWLAEQGKTREVARVVSTFFSAAHLLSESDYVSTLPSRFVDVMAPRFGLVSRELPLATPPIRFWVSAHRRDAGSEVHRLVRAMILKCAT